MKILVINAGSSSIKFTLYETDGEKLLAKGLIERINTPNARLRYSNHRDQKIENDISANSYEAAISQACLALMDKNAGVIDNLTEINGIGHRVVHGGAAMSESARITGVIKQIIMDCFALAPLHNPPNYEGIEACEHLFPNISMVAVFDTAFHQTMPPAAYTYAIPHEIAEKNKIRRYGFHGTSHRYVALKAADLLGKSMDELKMITVHLGNGCSITAVNRGQVNDTSMGLTPLEGLVMGTRCGDIDPAVVIFLRRLGYSLDEVDKLLNKSSGLLGLSGIGSNDMRDILQAIDNNNLQAKLALDVFVHRLVKYIGAYAAVMNGFDALIFTAGIGENVPRVRAMVCEPLEFLGIHLDQARNKANEYIISCDGTAPLAMVIPTNEELMIARETHRILMA
ncbi:MAG: acetate kinase [Verrucomicrobia bacterium]|nr:acetate kinase [Verrucomicrobiota bacterium]MBU4290185.1 acetate kinase [Verrucomicrobiota bacterium]MBU4430188.1 acetate kinase [Verrucomicrobiota bacterium]MBU4497931.1 acetate kinase [Verrucomicrobiota bacterium]MCG2681697.1 acetate kinase [Kiritimatiellia bacterium]